MQADLGVDENLLPGGHAVGEQVGGGVGRALDQAEADRSELVVAYGRARPPDGLAVERQLGPNCWQSFCRAVEVQKHHPAGRPTERVHPRHCLLAAVAALLKMYGRPDPADLVGDGPLVGVEPDPGPAGGSLADARGEPSGTWAHEAVRIAAGRPRIGLDTDERTIPNEIG